MNKKFFTSPTSLAELGEFALIERLVSICPSAGIPDLVVPAGTDDCAAIRSGEGRLALYTIDTMVEGVHFNLLYTPPHLLGWKLIVSSISDVCAMNGVPRYVMVALSLNDKFTVEVTEAVYCGIKDACDTYGLALIGGDTAYSAGGAMLTCAVVGEVAENKVARRNGAMSGDVLCVSGDLGGAYVGLRVLQREYKRIVKDPTILEAMEKYRYVVSRQLKPSARTDIVELLAEKEVVPTAMIDISDGLASDLLHICERSQVGCELYEKDIPIDSGTYFTALEFGVDPTECALWGGEDYELLFTVREEDYQKLKGSPHITAIGRILPAEAGRYMLSKTGKKYPLRRVGWDAFRGWQTQ